MDLLLGFIWLTRSEGRGKSGKRFSCLVGVLIEENEKSRSHGKIPPIFYEKWKFIREVGSRTSHRIGNEGSFSFQNYPLISMAKIMQKHQ